MKRRNKNKPRKGGKDYWARMESARLFQANVGFMQATSEMPLEFRLKFAWEIIKGVNPVTGKQGKYGAFGRKTWKKQEP